LQSVKEKQSTLFGWMVDGKRRLNENYCRFRQEFSLTSFQTDVYYH